MPRRYGARMDDDNDLPAEDAHDGLLDRMRDMPVGALDQNIIGDAGPTDVPPGTDPPQQDDPDLPTVDPDVENPLV